MSLSRKLRGEVCGQLSGKFSGTLLAVLASALVSIPCVLKAQDPCPYPVSLEYDGSTVPEESASGPWEVLIYDGDPTWEAIDGNLHINALDRGTLAFYRAEESLDRSKYSSIEVRAFIDEYDPSVWSVIIFLGVAISDGVKTAVLYPSDYPNKGRVGINWTGNRFQTGENVTDWSEFAVYKLELDKTDPDPNQHFAAAYVNGLKVLQVPYSELDNTADWVPTIPVESPYIVAFGTDQANSVWDYVNYEICEEPPELPPIGDQIDNMFVEIEELDVPMSVKIWLTNKLDKVTKWDDPLKQGQELYKISKHLFMMKFAGVVTDDAERLETLLDIARVSVAPEVDRIEGFRGQLRIDSLLMKESTVVPGEVSTHLRVFTELDPAGQHLSSTGNYEYALYARVGVVDSNGKLAWVGGEMHMLPARLEAGETYTPPHIDLYWDGYKLDGTPAVKGEYFLVGATIEYVQLDPGTNRITRYLDGAMQLPFNPPPLQPIPLPPPDDFVWVPVYRLRPEIPVERYYAGPAFPASGGNVGWTLDGIFYIHTDNLSSFWTDPVLHVYDSNTGSEHFTNDDCDQTLNNLIYHPQTGTPIFVPVSCHDYFGTLINCPMVNGTFNSCGHITANSDDPRIFMHAYANTKRGIGDIKFWRRVEDLSNMRVRYYLHWVQQDRNIGGTFLRFENGWQQGDEMDLIVPSSERADEISGLPPGTQPKACLMSSRVSIAECFALNGMAGGTRIDNLTATDTALALITPGQGEAAVVTLYVNDVKNAILDDGDGLGKELEEEIGTDPYEKDTDGDGILDGFEVLGIRAGDSICDYKTSPPTPCEDQALPTWGANPLHKDVFLETDYYDWGMVLDEINHCVENSDCKSNSLGCFSTVSDGRLCRCNDDSQCWKEGEGQPATRRRDERCVIPEGHVVSFCVSYGHPLHPEGAKFAADVANGCNGDTLYLDNPDGKDGFSLHFDNGMENTEDELVYRDVYGDWGGVDEVEVLSNPDNRPGNYEHGWRQHMNQIRKGVFRYGVGFPHGSGQSQVRHPYLWFNSDHYGHSGEIFIHEMGHTIGLHHWGKTEDWSCYNYKPHYVSLMNYLYDFESPNYHTDNPWDGNYIRFSEGERRYKLDPFTGNRTGEVIELDPTYIDESATSFPWVRTDLSDTIYDLTHGRWNPWYNILQHWVYPEVTYLYFDWNRDGELSHAKADFLLEDGSTFKYSIFEQKPIRWGPQIVAHREGQEDKLYLFYKRSDEDHLRYAKYNEDGCNIESVGPLGHREGHEPPCGTWEWWHVNVEEADDIDSQMSAVSVPRNLPEEDILWLFYKNTNDRVCALQKVTNDPNIQWLKHCMVVPIANGSDVEAVYYGGYILIFFMGPYDQNWMGTVNVIRMDPESRVWDVATAEFCQPDCYERETLYVPGVASYAGNMIVGVLVDQDGQMRLFEKTTDPENWWIFDKLTDSRHWLEHPGSGDYERQYTDGRPAIKIDRVPHTNIPRWHLWFHSAGDNYLRMVTSFEDPAGGTNYRPVFTFNVIGSRARHNLGYNVSTDFFLDKLRAAVSFNYDVWCGEDDECDPGYVFHPLADGIFEAKMKDTNDSEFIKENMADTLGPLFDGNYNERNKILDENHINRNLVPKDYDERYYDGIPDNNPEPPTDCTKTRRR